MPREHHNVFRGWQRQSAFIERKLTGTPILTEAQIRCLIDAGWTLTYGGLWRDQSGKEHTEAQVAEWLRAQATTQPGE